MKMLLILWIFGIVNCDKLDRTYLPPPGSVSSGGYPGDLNLPSEFLKENPLTLEPESDVLTSDFSLTTTLPKYPNIALGIDRQGPTTVNTPNILSNRPRIPVTENIYNIPTSVSSYDFPQTSTLSSVDTYYTTGAPVVIDDEKYPSTQPPSVLSTSTNLTPYRYLSINHKGDVGNTSEVTTSTTNSLNPYKYQQTISQIHSTQQVPEKSDVFSKHSQDFSDLSKSSPPSVSVPTSFVATNAINTSVLSQRTQTQDDLNAAILRYENILTPEGYAYIFDTSNGIHIKENGTTINGVKVKGSYSYTGDDGKVYSIEYTADENGFLPRGNHLPTAPPIPEAILKGIEQAERNRKLGIIDDGSYDEAKYGHGRYQGLMGRIPSMQYNSVTTTNNAFKKGRIPANEDVVFDTSHYDFNTPNKSEADKVSYTAKNDNKPNGNNILIPENEDSKNKFMKEPRNEFTGNTKNVSSVIEKYGKPNPIGYVVTSQTENNPNNKNLNVHSGYEYTQPESVLYDDNKLSQPLFSSIRRNNIPSPHNVTQTERNIVKNLTSPDTINFNSQRPGTDSQILKDILNDPNESSGYTNPKVMETGNIGITKPGIPTYYNRRTGPTKNADKKASQFTFTTLEPENPFTNVRSYNDQSYNTSNGNSKQGYKYPTTPLPSTNNLIDSQTPLTASLISSTLKPSTSSRQPTSAITSLPSGYQEQISGLKGAAEPRNSPTKVPDQSVIGLSENVKFKPRLDNFGIPSSAIIGEDFNGPKQPQRFDPKYGYYY